MKMAIRMFELLNWLYPNIFPGFLNRIHKIFSTIFNDDKLVEEFSELFKTRREFPDNIIAMPNRLENNGNPHLLQTLEA
jgi:hypothetical protein